MQVILNVVRLSVVVVLHGPFEIIATGFAQVAKVGWLFHLANIMGINLYANVLSPAVERRAWHVWIHGGHTAHRGKSRVIALFAYDAGDPSHCFQSWINDLNVWSAALAARSDCWYTHTLWGAFFSTQIQ